MDGLNTTFPNQPEYCTCHSDTVSLYNTAHSTGEGYFVRGGERITWLPDLRTRSTRGPQFEKTKLLSNKLSWELTQGKEVEEGPPLSQLTKNHSRGVHPDFLQGQ